MIVLPTPWFWLVQIIMCFITKKWNYYTEMNWRRNQQKEIKRYWGVMLVSHWKKKKKRQKLWPFAIPCLFMLIYNVCTAPRSNHRKSLTFMISAKYICVPFQESCSFLRICSVRKIWCGLVACCSTLAPPQKLHVPLTSCWTTKEREPQKCVHQSITYWLLF